MARVDIQPTIHWSLGSRSFPVSFRSDAMSMMRIIMGPADRPFITALRNRALIGLTAA